MKRSQINSYRWGFNDTNCWSSPLLLLLCVFLVVFWFILPQIYTYITRVPRTWRTGMTGGTSWQASSDSSSSWCPWRMTSGATSRKDKKLSLVTVFLQTSLHMFIIIPHFFIVWGFNGDCFPGIIAVNAVVLCCWRIPSMQRRMIKYFTSNPASSEYRLLSDRRETAAWSESSCLSGIHTLKVSVRFCLPRQKCSAFPWSCPPSATTPSSTWWPTCMSCGHFPQELSLS